MRDLQLAVIVDHEHDSACISLEMAGTHNVVLNVGPQHVSFACFWAEMGWQAGGLCMCMCMILGFELL